jgi:hypothetical protein
MESDYLARSKSNLEIIKKCAGAGGSKFYFKGVTTAEMEGFHRDVTDHIITNANNLSKMVA